ncbi:MAG: hypothetical protein WA633_21730, partial [Stellaceae bacterium]
QHFGEIGIDAQGDKFFEPVGLRFLQCAADVVLGDRDRVDLVLVEQGLEAAIRDRRQLGALQIKILDEQHAEHCGDDIPEVDVNFLVHFIHRCLPTSC